MTAAPDWFAAEADLHSWRRELLRLKRRARSRLAFTLFCALAITAAAVWFVARRHPPAESRILIRVTESQLLTEDSPLTSGDLSAYLYDAAFTNQNLAKIIARYDLYPLARARGESVAVETMKWYVDIEVYRNYFLARRAYNEPLRSARVAIKYQHEDPEISLKVARELAQLVIDTESKRRSGESGNLAELAGLALDRASSTLERRQLDLADRQRQLAEAKRGGEDARVAALRVEIARLGKEITASSDAVRRTRDAKRRADLQFAMDQRGVGLLFQIVDERPPPPPPDPREVAIRLAMLALVCFLFVLPLCAIGIGAFDQRLHDRDDVQRLGLPVVGHVPGFPGDEVGSMKARRKALHKPPAAER
jgi:hypothetical protein